MTGDRAGPGTTAAIGVLAVDVHVHGYGVPHRYTHDNEAIDGSQVSDMWVLS